MAADPAGLLRHAVALANNEPRAHIRVRPARRPQLMIASSAILLLAATGSVIIYHGAANPSPLASGGGTGRTDEDDDDRPYVLLAFLLSLIGIWLAILALVSDRFPRAAARVGQAIARALRAYFTGGRWHQ
ncbi:hypothetical protein BS78_10G228600 [Paspalum vaginatum]|nr:hypothetical protein BS78_10G228600 [Paspalum vaginatum]